MIPRRTAPVALAVAAAALLAVLVLGGGDPYTLEARMANAVGVKDGAPVTIGGVRVGTVDLQLDEERDQVRMRLEIDDDHAPLGRDTRARVVAQNLLGQKQIELLPDTKGPAAPSGMQLRTPVAETTDLDQLLNVLDADTRARLAIFVNEAGAAFTGRRADFHRLLQDLAPALSDGRDLLAELDDQNDTLERLVASSDRFVSDVTRKRGDMTRMVERFADTSTTVAARRGELRETLSRAPGTLRELRTFLAELRKTTGPLRTTAQHLTRSAAPLDQTLAQLEPFRRAATPALATARRIAPSVTSTATKLTPVLRQARGTVAELRTTAEKDLPGITDITDRSINNVMAVVENWARAIQFRDGMGHVFRGEASVGMDLLVSAVERLSGANAERQRKARRKQAAGRKPDPAPRREESAREEPRRKLSEKLRLPKTLPPALGDTIDRLGDVLGGVGRGLDGALDRLRPEPQRGKGNDPVTGLLDFLLGD